MTTAEAERPVGSASSSSNSNANQRGVSRVLAKLSHSLAEGEFYEAHMMYRTLYFRYTAQKRYQDCLDLLYDGAQKLIEKEQESSAADLCLLLVDTLEKRGPQPEDADNFEWVPRLGGLIRGLSATTVERETLIVCQYYTIKPFSIFLMYILIYLAPRCQMEHLCAWSVRTSGAAQTNSTCVLDRGQH